MSETSVYNGKPIRGLSLRQPFASLMFHDKIETREWKTEYRGMVLICAAKTQYSPGEMLEFCHAFQVNQIDRLLSIATMLDETNGTAGMAIGVGELYQVRPLQPNDTSKTFVKYKDGLHAHLFRNVQRIEPFPITGQLNYFALSVEEVAQIKIRS